MQKRCDEGLRHASGNVVSAADGIKSKGQVIGGSLDINGNDRAFLWQDGMMTDLNTLIPGDSQFIGRSRTLSGAERSSADYQH